MFSVGNYHRCCGTHAPSLHNLQLFLLPHTDSLSRATSGTSTSTARLYFLCGPRLITYLSSTHSYLTSVSSTMSCGAAQTPERVVQVVDDRRKAMKRVDDVELELAGYIAKEMLVTSADAANVVVHKHRADDSANPLAFLTAISTAFMTEAATREPVPSYTIVLSSSPSMQTATSTTIVMVFGSDDKRVKEVGEALKAKLGVKGGGKGSRWSGKFSGVWKDAKEGGMVNEILGL